MGRPTSLRARLVLVSVALTLIGLVVAGVATYGALRSFLSDRIDSQLEAAVADPQGLERDLRRPPVRSSGPALRFEATERSIALYYDDGTLYQSFTRIQAPSTISTGFSEVEIDGTDYRFLAQPQFDGSLLAVGISLEDMRGTLARLVWLEVALGLLALAATFAIGWHLIRVAMRPLANIEATAGAIADGDLAQRVENDDPATEVGRLGGALNVMLGRIEESFAEREASEQRLRQFVADASHELQTPLTSVRGYAELFRRGAVDRPDDLRDAMERIESEAERMSTLVDDLLLLARLDQGRPLEMDDVDLASAVQELAQDARVVAPDHTITVSVEGDVTVRGDDARLRQVIANLLGNARRHTPAGTHVDLSARRVDDHAVIEVSDDGPGLPDGDEDRVFERFFRADPSRARASGGTGLGLSIVAAIVAAHGGDVHVESAPGVGATFRVRLPIAGPAVGRTDHTQPSQPDAETPS